ncbi:MAG: plasmid stabilization protein [Burkholderiales bacterium]|nr:plasmid stabilization protein [Burkholderiales bacterium]
MPRAQWSAKRERQYQHIRDELLAHGRKPALAEEIAARTVNKVRAQAGEAEHPSRASLTDLSPGRRGGLRSHRGPGGRTYRQLYEQARAHGIPGRSTMNKAALEKALAR